MKTKEIKGINTQTQMVLKYMRQRGSITSAEAFRDLSITRLSGRIFDLRRAGYIIKSTMEEGRNKFGERTRYARYSLLEED